MANSTPKTPVETSPEEKEVPPTPLRCFTGAAISGGLTYVLYTLTYNIHDAFANKPIPNGNVTTTNIAVAVRTLVVGLSALGMVTFGIATLGLLGLGIQLLIRGMMQPQSSDDSQQTS